MLKGWGRRGVEGTVIRDWTEPRLCCWGSVREQVERAKASREEADEGRNRRRWCCRPLRVVVWTEEG